jgi:5-methylcytosine-specific restriction protein A
MSEKTGKSRLYNSKEWKNLRAEKLRRFPLCEMCIRERRISKACQIDHIRAISAGGAALDIRNLQSLCHSCHSRKTNHIEKLGHSRVPVKGCGIDGRPIDTNHWWNQRGR